MKDLVKMSVELNLVIADAYNKGLVVGYDVGVSVGRQQHKLKKENSEKAHTKQDKKQFT